MVELEELGQEDMTTVYNLLHNHYKYTGSLRAKEVMDDFKNEIKKFIKVMPIEFKRILQEKQTEVELSLTETSDG
jgi:glutamate synthase domain-containing protein 3